MHAGNGADVAMNPYEKKSLNARVSYTAKQFKFSYSCFGDDNNSMGIIILGNGPRRDYEALWIQPYE